MLEKYLNLMEANEGQFFKLKTIRNTLIHLDKFQEEQYDKICASGEKMNQMLTMLFGNQANIISPLRIQHSQNCRVEADAIQVIDCVRKIQQLKQDDRHKPIVILWRTNADVQTQENMRGGPHWHTYVLFLSERKMYFRDSLSKKTKICTFLAQLLQSGLNLKNRKIGGLVPKLTITNMETGQCPQQRHNDAGHWAVYNAIMLTQKNISVKQLATVSIPNGRKLRVLFSDLVKYQKDNSLNDKCDPQLSSLVQQAFEAYQRQISNNLVFQKQLKKQIFQEIIEKEKPTFLTLRQVSKFTQGFQKLNKQQLKQGVQKIIWKIPVSAEMKNQCEVEPFQISCEQYVNHISFQKMLTSQHFYIDKTLFIEPCFKQGARLLITRPSGFGKTTFAKMLHYFFSFQIVTKDINYEMPLIYSITNPSLKQKQFTNKYRNKKSIIAHKRPDMINQVGQWPVIYLTFVPGINKQSPMKSFYIPILRAIIEHIHYLRPYLQYKVNDPDNKNKSQDQDDLTYLKFLVNRVKQKDREQLVDSLRWFCQLLFRLFKKKVIVIIDDVDKTLTTSMQYKQVYGQIKAFQTELLIHALNNQIVYSAIMLGSLGNQIYSSIDKIQEYGMMSKMRLFSSAFGFTEDQLDEMLEKVVQNNWLGQKKKLQEWYNGYEIFKEPLYKIKPIIDFIQRAKQNQPEIFEDSQVQTLTNQHIIEQLLQKNIGKWAPQLNNLIYTKTIQVTLIKYFDIMKISSFQEFATLLSISGYLAPLPKNKTFKIPNNFIRKDFYQRFIAKQLSLDNGAAGVSMTITQISKNLQYLNQFGEAVEHFCLKKLKYQMQNEAYFQSLIGGILSMASVYLSNATHTVEFQQYTANLHRIDNLFCPIKRKSGSFLVFQYKVGKISQKDVKIDEALWQLYQKQYITVPYNMYREGQGWNEIIMRAVVFCSDSKGWKMQIVEYIHNFEQAKQIINVFSKFFKPKMTKQQIYQARNAILKYFKVKSINKILDKYKTPKSMFIPPPTTSQKKKKDLKILKQICQQIPSLETEFEKH